MGEKIHPLKPIKCDFCENEENNVCQKLSDLNDDYSDADGSVCTKCLGDEELFNTCCDCNTPFLIQDLNDEGRCEICQEAQDIRDSGDYDILIEHLN